MNRVLAVLGGGSAYAPGLVQALLHHADHHKINELRLHDIEPTKLEIVVKLAEKMSIAVGRPFSVIAAERLDDALRGATVVLNSTRPGGLAARHLDETLPLEFGLPGQETVGPGGFFFALRSVPYSLHVAERLQQLSPDAVLLNYTNPTNIVSQALAARPELRVLGLCDQSDEDLETLAHALGTSPITSFECVGLNHATWYSALTTREGKGVEIEGRIPAPGGLDEEHRLRFSLSFDLWTQARSGWPNSYLPYYTHPAAFIDLARRRGSRAKLIEASLPSYYQHFTEEAAKPEPRLLRHRGTSGFGDLAVRTLGAVFAREPRRLVLNVPNRGSVRTAHPDTVVEVPIELGAHGLRRIAVSDPPTFLVPLLERLERYQLASAEVAGQAS
jgi:6-phospho-beta-glucosidase